MNKKKELALKQAVMELTRSKQYVAAKSKALELVNGCPKDVEAWFALGQLHTQMREFPDAVTSYVKAVQSRSPIYLQALTRAVDICLDHQLYELGVEPAKLLQKAQPNLGKAPFALGVCIYHLGYYLKAVAHLLRALELEPENADYLLCLGFLYVNTGQADKAIAVYEQSRQVKGRDFVYHLSLLAHNYVHGISEQQVFEVHRRYGEILEQRYCDLEPFSANKKNSGLRIRVGYMSQDFVSHAVSYFIWPLLENYSRDKFELFCYSDTATPDQTTQKIRNCSEHWCDSSRMTDDQLYQQIRTDGIDLLVDLVGYLGKVRLGVFARKAAPIQVSYLGYPNTTGLTRVDYRITDALADPVGSTEHDYTETLIRLPGGFLCYTPDPNAPEVSALPAKNRSKRVCFGSCNNFPKISPQQIKLWAEILIAVPDSSFYIKACQLFEPALGERVIKLFEDRGVMRERIEIVGWTEDPLARLSCYDKIDIHLDSYPYNGTTTTLEAAWQGVPTISLAGATHRSRVGFDILSRLGLTDFIAQNAQEYVALAVRKAADLEALSDLRSQLRGRMKASTLMNRTRFVSELEAGYEQMWANYLRD